MHVYILIERGIGRSLMVADASYQAQVAERMIASDVHSAVRITDANHELTLTEANGQSVAYWLNSSGQLVRVGDAGGTAVAASGIWTWQFNLKDSLVEVTITWSCGVERSFTFGTLVAGGV